MPAGVAIEAGSLANVSELRDAFLTLHAHHQQIAPVALTQPDARAWAARAATYTRHLAAGEALLHIARGAEGCIGYAFTILHGGDADTFPLDAGYAELYTLVVLPAHRGVGIGSALLDTVDRELCARGIPNLIVAVLATNEAAIRLYRSRGLVPTETVLYRIGKRAAPRPRR